MSRHFRYVSLLLSRVYTVLSQCTCSFAYIALCTWEPLFDSSHVIVYESRVSVSCLIEEYSVWQWIRCLQGKV